ncbi:nucleolar protein 12 isoform X2 [Gambusia affinis]|uniref:nucleolar protein 12 isoform X2 n=1 Tax=Gambusia affinis TaxID=33528 RepID=UPI000F31C578|nr:nucleolar protein 12 isoform X2 [Gambusia affinis]
MKNPKHNNTASKKAKFKPGSKKRENKCVVMFDDKDRQDYLTGFHKRKIERRKAAVQEMKNKIKEEQSRVREERHKEYIKMLKEREEALEDELEDAVISTTESVQYDHPNHTVTVTTISDLDLSVAHLFRPATSDADEQREDDNKEEEKRLAMPKKPRDLIMNKKIRSLTTALSVCTSKRRRKGKQEGRDRRGRRPDKRPGVTEGVHRGGRTSKKQRRRQTGKKTDHLD